MRQHSVEKFLSVTEEIPLDTFNVADIGGKEMMAWRTDELAQYLKLNQIKSFFKTYTSFNLEQHCDIILDISNEPPQEYKDKYDMVISFDTLEHTPNPFEVCSNIIKMIKPDGLVYLATVFSWKLHGRQDYFRFSPDGLRVCFENKATEISCGWDEDISYIKNQTGVYFFGRKIIATD
jgi:SAM-dependent methyltransferase